MAKQKSELGEALGTCRTAFVGAGVFSMFINILMLVSPLYMLQVYDRVLASQNVTTLVVLTLVVVGLLAVSSALDVLRSRVLVRVGVRLDALMNARVFRSIFRAAVRHPGGGTAQPMRDLDAVREFLTGQGLFAFFDAPWMPLYLIAVYIIHPAIFWLSLVGAVVLLLLALITEVATRRTLMEATGANATSGRFIEHSLRNAEALRALGMVPAMQERWQGKRQRVLQLQALASDRAGTVTAITKFVRILLQTFVLGLGAYLVIQHEMTAGAMIAASVMMGRALAPVEQAVGTWKQLLVARGAWRRLNELLAAVPKEKTYMPLPAPRGDISLDRVIAAPPGGQVPTLKGISFNMGAGTVLGVIGPSAAGKSSLARVLVGVWPVHSGTVRIDGADIVTWDPDRLGGFIGYLPQDIELFEGTIAENIARFGEVTPDKVIAAAQLAGVHELILQLPQGYDTQIGPGGQSLSGGQRQRVALARALYGTPPVVVLDEPNSNLDGEGEAALGRTMAALRERGCSVIVITHRPSLLASVDYVMVMAAGQVESVGPRDEVLAKYLRPAAVVPATAQAAADVPAAQTATNS